MPSENFLGSWLLASYLIYKNLHRQIFLIFYLFVPTASPSAFSFLCAPVVLRHREAGCRQGSLAHAAWHYWPWHKSLCCPAELDGQSVSVLCVSDGCPVKLHYPQYHLWEEDGFAVWCPEQQRLCVRGWKFSDRLAYFKLDGFMGSNHNCPSMVREASSIHCSA